MEKVNTLKILPLVFKFNNEALDYPTNIVHTEDHTEDEWNSLINRTEDFLSFYKENGWGLNVIDVGKENMFLKIRYTIDENFCTVNGHKIHKNPPVFITEELNHVLNGGGFPSFYTNNLKNGKKIKTFVYHINYV